MRSEHCSTYLVGVLECPAVDAVVGRVQVALREPGDVAVLEAARANSVEGTIPVKSLPSHLSRKYEITTNP